MNIYNHQESVTEENTPFKIEKIYFYITVDLEEMTEKLLRIKIDDEWTPVMGLSKEMLKSLQAQMEKIAKQIGENIILAEFSIRKDLEIIKGDANT